MIFPMPNYDTWAISEGLKAGQLGMAMVDSNVLANLGLPPDQQKQGPGALHWITIDGFNKGQSGYDTMDDQFRVKDSVGGRVLGVPGRAAQGHGRGPPRARG